MKAPHLPEVTARVVAWHNRHPLAHRITPSQVHSIGEVRLPFASASPWRGAVGAPAAAPAAQAPAPGQPAPTLAEALAQRNARHPGTPDAEGGIEGLDVQSMLPEAAADLLAPTVAPAPTDSPNAVPSAAPTTAPDTADIDLALDAPAPDNADDDDDGEAALVIPLLDGDGAMPAPDSAARPPADTAGPAGPTPPAPVAEDLADAAVAGANGAGDATPAASAEPAPAALDLPADHTTPVAPHADAPEVAEVYPPPHGKVPASALARAVERRAAARGAAAHDNPQPAANAPAPSRWQRLVAALRLALTGRRSGLPPLRASFSRDFIWPLHPGQVARWAQRHGQPLPVAPADWPRRSIDADRARLAALRQKGLAHDLPLHVLTAAIGVGDRRMRVLLGADGSILGPRSYSRTRVGSAAALLALGLVGVGWTLRPLHGVDADTSAAALAALAASAAVAASAAPPPASAPAQAASATALADAASVPGAAASDSAVAHADAAANAAGSAPGDGQAQAGTAATPPGDAASQAQADIRPQLSDDDRYLARVEAARLRGEPPPPPPPTAAQGPVYAVVSPPSRQREAAAGSLVLMQSAAMRLTGQAPEHGELVQSQGQWRAAWWPFASLVDAERARVLLAGRGLKAEVVEF